MIRSRKNIAAVLMVFLFLLACPWAMAKEVAPPAPGKVSSGNQTIQIASGGLDRHYVIHIPPGYHANKKWPVVIMFHGGGGTAKGAMWETGWAEKADQEGFLAVFPEGTPPDPSRPGRFLGNPQTWNDGSTRHGIGAVDRDVAGCGVRFHDALRPGYTIQGGQKPDLCHRLLQRGLHVFSAGPGAILVHRRCRPGRRRRLAGSRRAGATCSPSVHHRNCRSAESFRRG